MSVAVLGGYGVFGSLVARELAQRGSTLVVIGREGRRAQAAAETLGPGHRGLAADAADPEAMARTLRGVRVVVDCAGAFAARGGVVLQACLETGCHYVDIADDRSHALRVRSEAHRFREQGLAAVHGCSSLPGLSGALAVLAARGHPAPPEAARITLFIGNDNAKGIGAIASLVSGLGRPIAAPQGRLRGFGAATTVRLPAPFWTRRVHAFESPDYDLLPALLGVRSVSVHVGFERRLAQAAFAALARLGSGYGDRTARLIAKLAPLSGRGGSSGGLVLAELSWADGSSRRAGLLALRDGQGMAVLPAVFAARRLEAGEPAVGAFTAYELLGAGPLVEQVAAAGFTTFSE